MTLRLSIFAFHIFLIPALTLASDVSVGSDGINSSILSQTGINIGIGQVEPGRPGTTLDGVGNFHVDVVPTGVFRQNGSSVLADVDAHAEHVAGVMISDNTGSLEGVAPNAELYASAFVTFGPGGEDVLKTNQHVASRNGGDVRAINHSWGMPQGSSSLDGSSYLTMGFDWSASGHNTLHGMARRSDVRCCPELV